MDEERYTDKRETGKKTHNRKFTLILVSLILLLCAAVGATVAFLVARDGPLKNTFQDAVISCEVTEDFDGTVKSDVRVKNTGTADAYIRAAILINWIPSGSGNTYSAATPGGSDYTIDIDTEHWFKASDGYYYYKTKVAPGASTERLIKDCSQSDTKFGYQLSVEIVASAIQASGTGADGTSAVADAWGLEPTQFS